MKHYYAVMSIHNGRHSILPQPSLKFAKSLVDFMSSDRTCFVLIGEEPFKEVEFG